jgi:hypothetical protein
VRQIAHPMPDVVIRILRWAKDQQPMMAAWLKALMPVISLRNRQVARMWPEVFVHDCWKPRVKV